MKIELPNGTLIHVDSAEELAAALKVIHAKDSAAPMNPEAAAADEVERVRAFFRSINSNARKFMLVLLSHKNGIKGEAFAEASGFATEKFGGIMGGIEKRAINQNLGGNQFIVSEQKSEGSLRYRHLAPGKMLQKYEFELHRISKQEGESGLISVGA